MQSKLKVCFISDGEIFEDWYFSESVCMGINSFVIMLVELNKFILAWGDNKYITKNNKYKLMHCDIESSKNTSI